MLPAVQPDEELPAWMVLGRAPRLNATLVAHAMSRLRLSAAAALLQASCQDWQCAGFGSSTRDYLCQAAALSYERRWLDDPRHQLLTFTDARYPHRLLSATRHPMVLYVLGDTRLLNSRQLAIVGSRNPSAGGRDTAYQFARTLAMEGLTVTSGLANGIDGEAHKGALAAGGGTIGVRARAWT